MTLIPLQNKGLVGGSSLCIHHFVWITSYMVSLLNVNIYNKLYFKIRHVVVTWYEAEGFTNRVFIEKTPQNYCNLARSIPDRIIKYLFFPNWTLQVWIVQWFQSLGKKLVSYVYFTSSIDTVDSILHKGVYLQGIPTSSSWVRIVVAQQKYVEGFIWGF